MAAHPLFRLLVGLGVVLPLLVGGAEPASATAGPTISLDRLEAAPGEPIIVTLSGFTGQVVTVAVCGNLAKRGSADCNMPASQAERIRHDQASTLTQLHVQPPPVPCPCLVRASTAGNDEFAVAGIVVLGHPEAPVVDPETGPLLSLSVEAERSPQGLLGWMRSALGGPTSYDVTVSVRNVTTETLSNVVLSGSARHRLNDDAVTLDLGRPGRIEPGRTWERTIEAEVPAPAIGRFTWTVTASGAGPSVEAEHRVSNNPLALYVLALVLVVDLMAVAWRLVTRGRRRRAAEPSLVSMPT